MQIVIEVPDDLKDTCDYDDIDEAMRHVTWFGLTLALAIRDGIVLSEQQAKKMAIEALEAESFDMPTGCWTCKFMKAWDPETDKCTLNGMEFTDRLCLMHKRADGCPLEALKAEPCEDAVKRESVLSTLDTMDKALDENRTVEAYKELLKECYKELPPVTPKQRWIPVSERLPKESLNCVLGWDDNRERCVFVQYVNGRFQFVGRDSSFKITAWMPLPEPCKEGESECR